MLQILIDAFPRRLDSRRRPVLRDLLKGDDLSRVAALASMLGPDGLTVAVTLGSLRHGRGCGVAMGGLLGPTIASAASGELLS